MSIQLDFWEKKLTKCFVEQALYKYFPSQTSKLYGKNKRGFYTKYTLSFQPLSYLTFYRDAGVCVFVSSREFAEITTRQQLIEQLQK